MDLMDEYSERIAEGRPTQIRRCKTCDCRQKSPAMKTHEVERRVAKYFKPRVNVVVPNVSWGITGLNYEADIVVLRPSGWADEIEIKISLADTRADLKKAHGHRSNLFRRLWFGLPAEILGCCLAHIPARAGVVVVQRCGEVEVIRKPETNAAAVKWSDKKRLKLLHLGAMRIWGPMS